MIETNNSKNYNNILIHFINYLGSCYACALCLDVIIVTKLNKDVFTFPMKWIPENPRWQNYIDIWNKIPLNIFILNTAKLSVIVTFYSF